MTAEQLQAERAERWRQKSSPVLTLEDAAAWLNTTGLCLFLPRRNQFLAPAPSFVEACSGGPSETPAPAAIENASSLMIRLIEDGAVIPLNLFGTPSEQPDFLATRDAFPYIFSLRGGRSWKVVPAKASPLVAEIWKLLEKDASLETTEIQAALGRELTEAAVLRGLMELWSALRVIPVYAVNEPTRWELTQTRFSDALNAANKIAQTTALSALVSLYLESVLAATPDEVGTFLSPLTSRSKVREVVNGLAATRQVSIIPVGTQTMFHVAGSLPEFADPEPAAAAPEAAQRPRIERPPFERTPRETRGPERRPSFGRDRTGDRPRTGPSRERFAVGGGARPGGAGRSSDRPLRRGADSQGNYPPRRKQFGANTGGPPRPEGRSGPGGERPTYRKQEGGERKSFTSKPFEKRPFDKPARPYGERGAAGARPPRRESSPRTSERTSSGELRPGSGRPSFRAGGGKFPPKKFGAGGKFPPKKFGPPKFGSDRPRPASGDRPFRPRRDEASDRPRTPRPYDRATGSDRPARPAGTNRGGRSYGAGKPWEAKKRDGEKRPFFRDKPAKTGRDDRSASPGSEGRSAGRSRAPAKRTSGWKPKPSGFSKSAKPAFGKPKFGGPKFGAAHPGGKKYGGGKPGFKSGPKPGGARPPFKKRKDEGKKSSE